MALNGSGPISIGGSTTGQSINLEFGRAAGATTSMSQLYRGGGVVPDAAANSAVPTSGAISLGNFYGAVNRVAINITLSANQTNYVLNTAKASGYVAGVSDITLTINSGVYVSSNTTGGPALDVDTSWSSGDTISIVNNGFIVGMGGNGGRGAGYYLTEAGLAGGGGGLAFRALRAVSVNNAGTIAGGGGGGGGGGAGEYRYSSGGYDFTERVSGGGGGGGRTGTTNSSGGAGGRWGSASYAGSGGSGTSSSAGGGGAGYSNSNIYSTAAVGGGGGGWGASGSSGSSGLVNTLPLGPYAGGSAGAAVSGNSNITWVATGTRLGAIA